MARKNSGGSTAKGRPATMRTQLKRPGGQARMARELANLRRAGGQAMVNRAMRNWGIRATTAADRKAGTAARGQKFTGGGRNG